MVDTEVRLGFDMVHVSCSTYAFYWPTFSVGYYATCHSPLLSAVVRSLGYLDHGSLFTSLVRWGDLSVPVNLARLTYLWLCERMAVRIGVWGDDH
jgi:hypothetical protein